VALSRATSVKYLQVIGFDKKHVMLAHPKVNNFYQNLLERQKEYGIKDITYEGEVVAIRERMYRQGNSRDLLRKTRVALEIRVEPEIPYQPGINSGGRDKIYYALSDYGNLNIREGKRYRFLIQNW
jgi:hypothetical protein